MGLKRLYFLSDSGYAMLEIAREIARVCPVSLELRYLHASETSLRLPVLHRMDAEEAVTEIFRQPEQYTLSQLLDRAAVTPGQLAALRSELLLPAETQPLGAAEYPALCASLRSSIRFRSMIAENSRSAYAAALGYLTQNGLADGTASGIVHTGWTSALQRYLRLLSEEIASVTGFYFALRTHPKAAADGVHHAWYFSAEKAVGLRTRFNWHVFRSMCAPPHGRTIAYQQDEQGLYVPVLSGNRPDALNEAQIAVCKEFAVLCAGEITYDKFPVEMMRRLTQQLLTGLMYRPDAREAEAFGSVSEHGIPLIAQPDNAIAALHRRHAPPPEGLLWEYGTLAASDLPMKGLVRRIMQKQDAAACLLEHLRSI